MRRWMGLVAAALGVAFVGHAHAAALKGDCPDGYVVKAGFNTDFPHKGMKRAFVVYPPQAAKTGAKGPAPVFVPMTGSVESTMDNLTVARSGATSLMAAQGFLVIGPVRECARQDPNVKGGACKLGRFTDHYPQG